MWSGVYQVGSEFDPFLLTAFRLEEIAHVKCLAQPVTQTLFELQIL
jgi:hypothetical protein